MIRALLILAGIAAATITLAAAEAARWWLTPDQPPTTMGARCAACGQLATAPGCVPADVTGNPCAYHPDIRC